MNKEQRANLPNLRERIVAASLLDLPQDVSLTLTQADIAIGALLEENERLSTQLRPSKKRAARTKRGNATAATGSKRKPAGRE